MDGLAVLGQRFGDDTAGLRFDFVHHFHRFNNAYHRVLGHLTANIDKRRRIRRAGTVECAYHRGDDLFQRHAFDRLGRCSGHLRRAHGRFGRRVRRSGRSRRCFSRCRFLQLQAETLPFDLEDRKVMFFHQIDDGFDFFEVFRIQARSSGQG